MTAEDKPQFAEIIYSIYKFWNREPSSMDLTIWWETLVGYDLAAVRVALTRHMRNPDVGQFIPKPADVVKELGGTSADASMIAWAKVIGAVRKVGSYDSVLFDDPITNIVVRDMGGWIWFGQQTEKELPFIEKRFRDAYRAWRARGLFGADPVLRLPGIFEAANTANGYKAPALRLIGDQATAKALSEGGTAPLLTEGRT